MVQDGDFWDIEGTTSYVISRSFTVVALQFPDELLKEASKVSRALQDACAAAGAIVQVEHIKRSISEQCVLAARSYQISMLVLSCMIAGICDGRHHVQQPWCG